MIADLDAIRVFAAIAEAKSFRGAALALKLPRSTVSRRLGELEAALDTRLFQRTTRRVTLTDAGRSFLERVAPALAAIADAERTITDARAEPRGLIRMTATTTMGDRVGAVAMELLAEYPDVRIEIDLTDRQVDLVGEGYDIAIRSGALADSTLIARTLGVGRAGYFASPVYLARRGAPATVKELASHDGVIFSGRQRDEVKLKRRLVVNSLRVVAKAAIAGFGIAWLPELLAAEHVANGTLVPVLPETWPPSAPFSLVYPSARHLAPQVRAAIELLATRLAIVPTVGQSAPKGRIVPKRPKRDGAAHGNHSSDRSDGKRGGRGDRRARR